MISIILPVFNREKILPKFIESVISQTFQDFEVIIVDDGSVDNSLKIAEEYAKKNPKIHCIKHQRNMGLPAARNTGIKLSKGNLIFFGEDDVILDPKCLEQLVETFAELKGKCKVGAIAPRLISSNKYNDINYVGTIAKIDSLTGDFHQNWSSNAKITEVKFLHACSIVDREVFEEIGGYDTRLYRGNYIREESDLYFRARKAGFKLFFQPQALAWHLHSSKGGCKKPLLQSNYYTIRNHSLFLTKFYGLKATYMIPSYCIFFTLNVLRARIST
jgi:glycosyltransferase involved in cell wall biosynthesis